MALVVDLTRLTAAYAARLMVEAGHRVIRVEPAVGDDVRRESPFLDDKADLEHGAYHHFLNAGKQSVTINADDIDGREALRALVGIADCVVVSRPFACDALWFSEANPKVIVVEVDDVRNELCAYARSGLLSITGHPGAAPVVLGGHSALSMIGLYVAVAVSAALLGSRISGRGQHVQVSTQQCLEAMGEQSLLTYHTTGNAPDRRGFRGVVTAISGAFECSDGYWMVSIPHEPRGWTKFVEWTNDPELIADKSLLDEGERQLKRDAVLDRVSNWSKQHEKERLVGEAQKRHIPAAPVSTVLDLARDPQLMARGFLKEIDHQILGRIPFPMGATASRNGMVLSAAPKLGEHNAIVLTELGYSPAAIQAMLEAGAL